MLKETCQLILETPFIYSTTELSIQNQLCKWINLVSSLLGLSSECTLTSIRLLRSCYDTWIIKYPAEPVDLLAVIIIIISSKYVDSNHVGMDYAARKMLHNRFNKNQLIEHEKNLLILVKFIIPKDYFLELMYMCKHFFSKNINMVGLLSFTSQKFIEISTEKPVYLLIEMLASIYYIVRCYQKIAKFKFDSFSFFEFTNHYDCSMEAILKSFEILSLNFKAI